MTPIDRRAGPFVLLLSVASALWAWWAGQPYWLLLSMGTLVWTSWTRRPKAWPMVMLAAIPLAAVPVLGTLAGPGSHTFLAGLLAPVLLYSTALGELSSSVNDDEAFGPGAISFLGFLATVSAGTLALLALYYVDALLTTDLMPYNSDLMWPLSLLFLGSIGTSLTIKAAGLERALTGEREVSG